MVSKELVGTRIRQVRTKQRKTLKDVEAASGFSSTHISEIERGRTSPTIGALIRIAHALDKDPSFFIEERELDEVCVTSLEARPSPSIGLEFPGTGVRVESLTRGILGGRLLAYEITLEGGGSAHVSNLPESGDLCLTCLEGACEIAIGERVVPFEPRDTLHVAVDDAMISLRGGGGERCAHVLVVIDPKEAIY
jgi:transcriptional regulator with XRE-family HTH domain